MVLRFPCEIIGWYVLPAVRGELARQLVEKKKLSRHEAAARLGLSEAAVCYYLKKKRGSKFRLGNAQIKKIEKMAEGLASAGPENNVLIAKTCRLCKELRKEKQICGFHRESGELTGCEACCK